MLFDDVEDPRTTMLAVKYMAVDWLYQQFSHISRTGPKNTFDTLTASSNIERMATARQERSEAKLRMQMALIKQRMSKDSIWTSKCVHLGISLYCPQIYILWIAYNGIPTRNGHETEVHRISCAVWELLFQISFPFICN